MRLYCKFQFETLKKVMLMEKKFEKKINIHVKVKMKYSTFLRPVKGKVALFSLLSSEEIKSQ